MRKRHIIVLGSYIFTILFTALPLQAGDLLFGLRTAVHVGRMASFDGINFDGYPKHSYPPGFTVGVLAETKIANKMSVRAEMSFLRLVSKVTAGSVRESIIVQEIRSSYLHFPVLLQYHTNWWPYFLVGTDLGYLINAKYEYSDPFLGAGTIEITNNLPSVDISVTLGIGQRFKLLHMPFFWEARLILGLTRYTQKGVDFRNIGTWKNNILQLGLGVLFL